MQKYHHFEQGRGGLFKPPFMVNGEQVPAVGTYDCQTCFCIYVLFDNDEVFIAHIVAATTLPPGPETQERHEKVWNTTPEKGEALKQAVLLQLGSELGQQGSRKVVKSLSVCPSMFEDQEKVHGWWINEAVKEYFKVGDQMEVGHGFVPGPDIQTQFFMWEGKNGTNRSLAEKRPRDYNWEAANGVLSKEEVISGDPGPWDFWFVDGRWEVGSE